MKITSKLFSYDRHFSRGQMRTPAGEILQIAELSVIKGGEITAHIQKCDEITYAISGKATVYSGDSVMQMEAGQIHFIRSGEYHRIVADPCENFRYCCIGYLPDPQCESIRAFLEAVRYRKDFLVEDIGSVRKLFALLIDEFYIRDEESNDMIYFYFCQMLILLYRILSGKAREKLNKSNNSASNHAVYRALKYMDREYLNITKIKDIAEALSYSEYYLCHIFKEKMDITLKEYLMQKKIRTAVELLENSSMSITDISDQLHFSSVHSFGIAFRRYMGISPSQHRQLALSEQ